MADIVRNWGYMGPGVSNRRYHTTVGQLVEGGKCTVKVLTSPDNWYGVTYAADKPKVVAALRQLTESGRYPDGLWD